MDEYSARGLAVIGVTDESAGVVQPYLNENGVRYKVALGGAPGYRSRGIPHAWLVSPQGSIVWTGHPSSLSDDEIEEQLQSVRLAPSFDLPSELSRAERQLNAGRFGRGIRDLEGAIEDASPEVAEAAREAIAEAVAYGEAQLERADELAEAGYYGDAMPVLERVQQAFRGHELSDRAREQLSEWRRDRGVRAEMEAAELVGRAEELIRQRNYRAAAQLLNRVARSSRFADTKARARAEEQLRSIEDKL